MRSTLQEDLPRKVGAQAACYFVVGAQAWWVHRQHATSWWAQFDGSDVSNEDGESDNVCGQAVAWCLSLTASSYDDG